MAHNSKSNGRPVNHRRLIWLALLFLTSMGVTYIVARGIGRSPAAPPGMVWIDGGTFQMGTEGETRNRNEQPAHQVQVDGFFMDETEVTNAQFQKFVDATGYVTTAERAVVWEELKKQTPAGTPKPPDDQLVPGSLVFIPPTREVSQNDMSQWWQWTAGANWKHPEGPKSELTGREQHPVVHVSWDDVSAYAQWAGKRLPSEAEWEYASRGKLVGKKYVWGDNAPTESDGNFANIWQGVFPNKNLKIDGWERTAPVKSYPANGFRLYDMAGNVWEWCSDWYRADAYVRGGDKLQVNPKGPSDYWDPNEPLVPKRVIRGGSFLCHVSYCESYRPAARRGSAVDTGTSHVGFRCVKSQSSN